MSAPHEILAAAAKLQQEKDAEYGAGWRDFGPVMDALFPKGLTLVSPRDFGRFALFTLAAAKLSRYASNFDNGGHSDSLRDLSVYAAMLESLDAGS